MPNLESRLEKSIDIISNRFYNVELQFMSIAGERLKSIYGLTNEQIRQYLYSGEFITDTRLDVKKVERSLSQAHRQNLNDMAGLFDDITAEVYNEGEELAEAKEATLSPKREYVSAANPLLAQAVRNYEVMARSTAVNDSYKKTIRQFVGRIASEGEDRLNAPMAMRQAIRELTAQGISSIDYKSGRSVRMDSAVRNSLMGEYGEIVRQIQSKVSEEIGMDAVEITVEHACAWDHLDVQGRVFTNEEYERLQNFEVATDIDGVKVQLGGSRQIGQYNCRHMAVGFLIGVSERSYSQEELEAVNKRNENGVTYNGKKMTLYEATQEQRRIETAMRHERENLNLLKEVRDTDPSMERAYQKSRERLAELRNEYKSLGAVLEPKAIRMKMERSYVPRGSTGGDSGGLRDKGEKTQKLYSDTYYNSIRNRDSQSDIAAIAKNSIFSESQISDIREHIFVREHNLGDGDYGQFQSDYRIAQAWQRLEQGKGTELDNLLLNHELEELKLMKEYGYDYPTAHNMAHRKYPWSEKIEREEK